MTLGRRIYIKIDERDPMREQSCPAARSEVDASIYADFHTEMGDFVHVDRVKLTHQFLGAQPCRFGGKLDQLCGCFDELADELVDHCIPVP